uniref:Uncharacterized protein n=1 Tax=Arundo donax TaxID=35708 RepID=A0A0A9BLQ9_ARUDO
MFVVSSFFSPFVHVAVSLGFRLFFAIFVRC